LFNKTLKRINFSSNTLVEAIIQTNLKEKIIPNAETLKISDDDFLSQQISLIYIRDNIS
jgi:hypothetical protein